MTIENQNLHKVYAAANEGKLGDALWCCAHAANSAWAGANKALEVNFKGLIAKPLKMPNADPAENMVAQIFATIARHNGYDWRELIEAARL
jgi:hypothetical protein